MRWLAVSLLVAAAVWPARAADLPAFQPCWRGQFGATLQAWGFNSTPTNASEFGFYGPEVYSPDTGWTNAHGPSQALVVAEMVGIGWFLSNPDISTTLSGIWDLGYGGGSVTLTIPGATGTPSAKRQVWVQVTEAITADVTMTNTVTVAGGTLLGSIQRTTIEAHPNWTWVVSQSKWELPAGSATTMVTVAGGCPDCNSSGGGQNAFVESVVVDTRLVDSALISPGGSLAVAVQSECENFAVIPGSTYHWEIRDAAGVAGVGFDQLSAGTNTIDIQATSASNCLVKLVSLNGASAGLAANFNANATSSWTLATAPGGSLLNFDAGKFTLSYTTNEFRNDLRGGVFSLAANGSSLETHFTPNRPPTATNVAFTRGSGMPVRIKISDLLAGTADPDGDGRAFASVGASTNGATITTDGTFISYTPANHRAESFAYTVRDNRAYRPGDTVRTGQALIQISVMPTEGSVQGLAFSAGGVTVNFAGIPGYTYVIQRSPTGLQGSWLDLLTTNAPPNGLFDFLDASPLNPTGFYRTRSQ